MSTAIMSQHLHLEAQASLYIGMCTASRFHSTVSTFACWFGIYSFKSSVVWQRDSLFIFIANLKSCAARLVVLICLTHFDATWLLSLVRKEFWEVPFYHQLKHLWKSQIAIYRTLLQWFWEPFVYLWTTRAGWFFMQFVDAQLGSVSIR